LKRTKILPLVLQENRDLDVDGGVDVALLVEVDVVEAEEATTNAN
jgi:hypothetical protein